MSAYRINPDSSGCQIEDSDRGVTVRELWHVTGMPVGTPWAAYADGALPALFSQHPDPRFATALCRSRRLIEFWNVSPTESQAKVYVVWSSIAAWGASFSRNTRSSYRFEQIEIPVWRRFGTSNSYQYLPVPYSRQIDIRIERRNLGNYSVSEFERIKGRAVGNVYQLDTPTGLKYLFTGAPYYKTPAGSLIVDYTFELAVAVQAIPANDPTLKNAIAIPALAENQIWCNDRGTQLTSTPSITVVLETRFTPSGTGGPALPQL